MTATVSWNQDRVLELEFDSPWTWKDYDTASEAMGMMASMSANPISVIVDLLKAPQTTTVIEHVHRTLHSKPENVHRVVIIGSPILVEMLRRAVVNADGHLHTDVEFAASRADAYRMLFGQAAPELNPN